MLDPTSGDPTPDGAVVLAALGRAAEPDLALTALGRILEGGGDFLHLRHDVFHSI